MIAKRRLKGKPKTKTKLKETLVSFGVGGDQLISCKCYDPRGDEQNAANEPGLESERHRTGSESNTNSNPGKANPLIAINLTAGTTSAATKPQQIKTSVSKSGQVELDGKALDQSSLVESSNPNPKPSNNDPLDGSTSTACNVDDVKRNFITLVRYNKLQYFFLGTLIYSVMNICFIFYALFRMSELDNVDDDNELNKTTTSATRLSQDAAQQAPEGHQFNHAGYISTNEQHLEQFICLFGQSVLQSKRSFVELSLAIQVSGMLLLALITAITTLQFSFKDANKKEAPTVSSTMLTQIQATPTTTRTNKKSITRFGYLMAKVELPLQSLGLLLALLLLYLPFISTNFNLILILINNQTTTNNDILKRAAQGETFPHILLTDRQQLSPFSYYRNQINNNNNNNMDESSPSNSPLLLFPQNTSNSHYLPYIASIFPDHCSLAALLPRLFLTPIAPLLALIYFQPLLLEGTSLNMKLVSILTILPLFILALANFWLAHYIRPPKNMFPSSLQQQLQQTGVLPSEPPQQKLLERHLEANEGSISSVLLTSLPLIFILALLKRRYFVKIVTRDTFAGASQLIEAKVSLEHQRQQQETLLLSVLPAYVAEQVKRNMLKKTTTGQPGVNLDSIIGGQEHNATNFTSHQATTNNTTTATRSTNSPAQASSSTLALTNSHSRNIALLSSAGCSMFKSPSHLQIGGQQQTAAASATSLIAAVTSRHKLSADHSTGGIKVAQTSVSAFGIARNPSMKLNLSFTSSLFGDSLGGTKDSALKVAQSALSPTVQHHTSPFQQHPSTGNVIGPSGGQHRRGFNELYIRTYNNVSLLYGDIVGFTRLCTQLSSSQLVRVLNDLFSHFDLLAEKHKIMRIKILGDCYYGVSGIPEFAVMGAKSRASRNDNHAINCVNMGLDMIHYIKCLNVERASTGENTISHSISSCIEGRVTQANPLLNSKAGSIEEANASCCRSDSYKISSDSGQSKLAGSLTPLPAFELNMRIGVHSGHIHSGVIGLKKWQFDVWSNDVSIAMHCESSGTAGRVQVTEATIQQLHGAFTFEKASGAQQDSFLASKDISTYLIRDRVKSSLSLQIEDPTSLSNEKFAKKKKQQIQLHQQQQQRQQHSSAKSNGDSSSNIQDEDNIRAATIGTIKQTLLAGETCNANSSNSIGIAISHHDISPVLMRFQDSTIGRLYSRRAIDNLVQEIISLVVLLIVILPLLSVQLLDLLQFESSSVLLVVAVLSLLLVLVNFLPETNLELDLKEGSNLNSSLTSLVKDESSQGSVKLAPITKNHCAQADKTEEGDLKDKVDEEDKNRAHIVVLLNSLRNSAQYLYKELRVLIRTKLIKILVMEIRKSKIRSTIVVLLIVTVILIQSYLIIFKHYCKRDIIVKQSVNGREILINSPPLISSKQDEGNVISKARINEQYHLTVILLLISVELSVNLLTYKTKCLIILSIISLHLLYILQPMLIHQEHFCQYTTLEKTNEVNLDAPTDREHFYNNNNRQVKYIQLITNQQVIDWSSNALLFVMALWSLAFARQLEYTKKTNFLWRNRLNVDHEELEYISGINKVLLENILPSHVVQYYLTNPNGQGTQNNLPNSKPYMRMSKYS